MMRPRLLDAFCGAGGCSVGYHRAGFDVTGIDIASQPRYPFEFVQADAMEFITAHGHEFDVIHASPPCQAYSCGSKRAGTSHRHPDLVDVTRQVLRRTGRPWVMENVPGSPLRPGIVLCGSMFGLEVRRHRLFEMEPDPFGVFVVLPECDHSGRVFSVFGHGSGNRNGNKRPDAGTVDEWRRAMGIDWMIRNELSQAIPPAYTEFIGAQLLACVG